MGVLRGVGEREGSVGQGSARSELRAALHQLPGRTAEGLGNLARPQEVAMQ